ncbi:Mitochondrial import inner membrane translocase subunit tim23 [Coccidioides posadasii str. Silveira]|uniref:Mitochondrial import inner membrane translocase subunit TIM23 n=1 Tax=Coccidioides posadasii (strain RMSCC 757 / Silveira) TaxID=443226 RepID=E9D7S6_COCPS|nr:mitochondrial import inner membrane translocase subunit tim23 [Coccidioides posadasii str. Silveira]QVM05453.1 Mitochondrial import inner membrane translocase subunit tim23 [Coccidioides posadasii str. Silveira]
MSIWDTLSGRKSSTSPAPAAFDPSSAHDVTSFLSSTAIPDPSELHPLAGLNRETLDYLTLEDSTLNELPGSQSALPSRGWSDDLSYGTGTTYLTALSIGGLWGLTEGLRKAPPSAPPKLRLNAVLNSVTRRGPFLGNSAGVLAMTYNGINSTLGYARGKHDAANSIVAGALSGMLFKSTRGLRPMMISGGIVAGVAAAWTVARRVFFS